jgi:hypothetical protein
MGPPDDVPADEGPPEKRLLFRGEVGEFAYCVEEGGRFSHERVRKQDWRIIENDVGTRGS